MTREMIERVAFEVLGRSIFVQDYSYSLVRISSNDLAITPADVLAFVALAGGEAEWRDDGFVIVLRPEEEA